MKSEFMMIDPNELVIDMPVDEEHVQNLMRQIESVGEIISEPQVWLHDMRIIDGFHRAVAAQRLGMKEVRCKVCDCTEEEFWDLRILAAKKHHAVENDRLVAWMLESWKASKWHRPDEAHGLREMTKAVWENEKGTYRIEDQELADWIKQKANKWGTHVDEVIFAVVRAGGIQRNTWKDGLSRKYGLTFEQREIIDSIYVPRGAKESDVEEWIETEGVHNDNRGEGLRDFLRRKKETNKEQEKQEEVQRARLADWAETPQGQAALTKERLEDVKSTINRAFSILSSARWEMRDLPESPLLLAQHMEATRQIIVELFPDSQEAGEVNPIWLENIELRKKVAEQAERIASLERALKSKQSIKESVKDTLAWSSIQIEATG